MASTELNVVVYVYLVLLFVGSKSISFERTWAARHRMSALSVVVKHGVGKC